MKMDFQIDIQRRRILLASAGLLGLGLPSLSFAKPSKLKLSSTPFTLGIASGDPDKSGFVIWTRLAPSPLDESGLGGLSDQSIEVGWALADNPEMKKPLRLGTALAQRSWGYAVHIDVDGLSADRPYWYCFRLGDWQSTIGRAWTSPAERAEISSLRFALASCQHYEQGYYSAYRHMVNDDPRLILHVGDYIYEKSADPGVRKHEAGESFSLTDYRRRYARYKTDADLQRAHAHCPWLMTWDDHEVANDYAGIHPSGQEAQEAFLLRRAAAYQAYLENTPVRRRVFPGADDEVHLYRKSQFGSLIDFHMLDTRQYRSAEVCKAPPKAPLPLDCADRLEPNRTMIGTAQENWLQKSLQSSQTLWNSVAQGVLVAPFDHQPGPGYRASPDPWDGYPAARTRLLEQLAKKANPVVLTGDAHAFFANDLQLSSDNQKSRIVATELVGTSITSRGTSHYDAIVKKVLPENPHIKFFDSRSRGYVTCDIDRKAWRTLYRAVDDVTDPDSGIHTLRSFAIEAGKPGVQNA